MTIVTSHPASFLDHMGKLNVDTGIVTFYGIAFANIVEASTVLKMIKMEEVDHSFWSKYGAGITTIHGSVIAGGQNNPFKWFSSEKTAISYLRDIYTYKGLR